MEDLWSVWFLIGAAFVFWMQAGFAMVETGFTRAKNAGNIIMKNLMDFCIGTVMWFVIGASFMLSYTDPATGEVSRGIWSFLGKPGFSVFSDYANFDFSNFVFNLVFCATTATIVSGAMAERTKFSSYCIYSAIISGIIYPIEAHWTWGGGFLAQWGFHDYAGSACIHMVGGICALIGAAMVGPRIGKFTRDANGKITKVKAFPGHNLTIGALGVFILWLGWYGFNGAACTQLLGVGGLAAVFTTTTIAPAVACVTTMIFTWIKNKKPDVSMTLNASLAGLVAITPTCATVDAIGATVIGIVAGILVVLVVELLDLKLHIDDPVGAVAVHLANGIWGTLSDGLFNVESGLFYGGGIKHLGIQALGEFTIVAWTAACMTLVFWAIKKFHGLRASREEEVIGLDKLEHGIDSAYGGFIMAPQVMTGGQAGIGGLSAGDLSYVLGESSSTGTTTDNVPVEKAIPVTRETSRPDAKFHMVTIVTRPSKFDALKKAMNDISVTGMTLTNVLGCGQQHGNVQKYRGVPMDITLLPKIKVDIVVSEVPVDLVITDRKSVV